MGPEATLLFLEKFYALTRSRREQDRPALLLDMDPAVPDRNEAWRAGETAPASALARMGRRLAQAGADFCVMPCLTAHGFANDFERDAHIPLLRLPGVVADALLDRRVATVGVLATTTTLEMQLLQPAFLARDVEALVPDADNQTALMRAIYDLKRGGDAHDRVAAVAERLAERGADALLVACTDLSLLGLTEAAGCPVLDALDVLAHRTLAETAARAG